MKALFTSLGLMLCAGVAAALEKSPKSEAPRLLTDGLGDTAIGLVLVLGLIALLAWGLRRFGRVPAGGRGMVQVLGGVSLGNRERAMLLSVDGVRLLVGVSPGQVRTLHVLGTATPATEKGFAAELAQAQSEETV